MNFRMTRLMIVFWELGCSVWKLLVADFAVYVGRPLNMIILLGISLDGLVND